MSITPKAEGHQSKKKAHQDSLKECIENNHNFTLVGTLECWNNGILGLNSNKNFFTHYSTIPLFQIPLSRFKGITDYFHPGKG
jgi:hypothetical protein